MSSHLELTAVHWTYLVGVIAVLVTMVLRRNVLLPAILATFAVALTMSGSLPRAVMTVFNASFVAAKELFSIFLVIALMTALLNALRAIGADERMVRPFRRVMVNGTVSYICLAVVTYFISLFFWPTPAIPLVAAILLPAAIAAGLPPVAGALAIAIAGQGMALSSDYVIGVAPGITAKAAGISALLVADRALVLSLITGGVALVLAYLGIRSEIRKPSGQWLAQWQSQGNDVPAVAEGGSYHPESLAAATAPVGSERPQDCTVWSRIFAVATPLAFLAVVSCMVLPRFVSGMEPLQGGEAAALVGGTAALLMLAATFALTNGRGVFDRVADNVTDGLVFAFRAMGAVLPIAGFFFLGGTEVSDAILGTPGHGPALLGDLVQAAHNWLPQGRSSVAYGMLVFGMVTGIDGSGFAGLPLIGSLSSAFAQASHIEAATLSAIGMMGSIWTGGGTLVAWSSLIAVTGFCRVDVQVVVRKIFLPVVAGLIVSTLAALFIW